MALCAGCCSRIQQRVALLVGGMARLRPAIIWLIVVALAAVVACCAVAVPVAYLASVQRMRVYTVLSASERNDVSSPVFTVVQSTTVPRSSRSNLVVTRQVLRTVGPSATRGAALVDAKRSLLVTTALNTRRGGELLALDDAAALVIDVTSLRSGEDTSATIETVLPGATNIGIDVDTGELIARIGTPSAGALVAVKYSGTNAGAVRWLSTSFPTVSLGVPAYDIVSAESPNGVRGCVQPMQMVNTRHGSTLLVLSSSGVEAVNLRTGDTQKLFVVLSAACPYGTGTETDVPSCVRFAATHAHVVVTVNEPDPSGYTVWVVPISAVGGADTPRATLLYRRAATQALAIAATASGQASAFAVVERYGELVSVYAGSTRMRDVSGLSFVRSVSGMRSSLAGISVG